MSIVLPQELQTQKINSLSGELRDIAEELLAEKFDIKEEVVPQRDDSFRGMGPQCYCGPQYAQRCPAHESTYNNGGQFGSPSEVVGHFDTWRDFSRRVQQISIYITSPSHIVRGMMELLEKADMENWPRYRRTFIMAPDIARYLMIEPGLDFREGVQPSFHGADIRAEYGYEKGRIFLECR